MTSTLAGYEPFVPKRPTRMPACSAHGARPPRVVLAHARPIDNSAPCVHVDLLHKAMAFDVRSLPLVDCWCRVDPTGIGGALPGSVTSAITSTIEGASGLRGRADHEPQRCEVLGVADKLGSIERATRRSRGDSRRSRVYTKRNPERGHRLQGRRWLRLREADCGGSGARGYRLRLEWQLAFVAGQLNGGHAN